MAIKAALASKTELRATLRARAAKQRFPVAQWKEDLSIMQDTAIKLSKKQVKKQKTKSDNYSGIDLLDNGTMTPGRSWWGARSMPNTAPQSEISTRVQSRAPSPEGSEQGNGIFSLGRRTGPGHDHPSKREGRQRKRLSKPPPLTRNSSRGTSTAPNSRASSPARRSLRKSLINLRTSLASNAGGTTSESFPAVPPMPERVAANRMSRVTEITDENTTTNTNQDQADSHGSRPQLCSEEETNSHRDSTSGESGQNHPDNDDSADESVIEEYLLTPEQLEARKKTVKWAAPRPSPAAPPSFARSAAVWSESASPSRPATPLAEDSLLSGWPNDSIAPSEPPMAPAAAYLSLGSVLQGKKDYKLQSVEPFFTDPTGFYYNAFDKKLTNLNGKTSEGSLCVEEFLTLSERDWFSRFRNVKMGKSPASTPASSVFRLDKYNNNDGCSIETPPWHSDGGSDDEAGQFPLIENYQAPRGIKRLLLRRCGQWPLYSFLLAFVSSL